MTTLNGTSLIPLIRARNSNALKAVLESLSAFEIADFMATRSQHDQLYIFGLLPAPLAAKTLDLLPPRRQKFILHSLTQTQAVDILLEMNPDDRTALLEELPKAIRDRYVMLLPNGERKTATTLLSYPEDSVGRLMTTDYIAVKMNWTVVEVLDYIRLYGHDSETLNVIYVVDDAHVLIDDIKIRDFLLAPRGSTVSELVDKKFIALSVYDKTEKAIFVFKKHDRVALPVIDPQGVLVGIVTIDDVLRLASEKNTHNMQQIGGVEALDEPYMQIPFLELMKKRAHWLVLLFLGEMLTATAMGLFEQEIAHAVVLSLFLPLIISSGGNAGSQSSSLIIRALALGEVKLQDWWRVMRREIFSGLFLGTVLGLVGFARVTLWSSVSTIYGPHWLAIAITVGLALIGVVLWGSLSGSMLPLILRALRIDPATASAPLVATLVDVTGIIIYFSIALYILKGTLL